MKKYDQTNSTPGPLKPGQKDDDQGRENRTPGHGKDHDHTPSKGPTSIETKNDERTWRNHESFK